MSFSQIDLDNLAKTYTEAWNSKVPEAVAAFHADVPDLFLKCDGVRAAGDHVVYLWTFTGHHAETGNPLSVGGWEEWELDEDMKITSSLGWFDGEEYERQVAG